MKKIALLLLLLVTTFVFTGSVAAKSFSGTVQDLLKRKQAQKCTYSYKLNKKTLNGVMFTDKQKYRSEFTTLMNKQKVKTYSLSDGTWMYTWTSNSNQGTKMNLKQIQELAKKNDPKVKKNQNFQNFNKQLKSKYKFSCKNANINPSLFKVPKNITFTDLSAMLEGLEKMGVSLQQKSENKDATQQLCSLCNSLPEEAKTQCLANCQ